ncbi:hypothetical protein HO133_008281 [Letharia lupina]|uniref:Uncharacterized protein n=1 Tax=Letharia lupina TaxID=560253 RepID=A0A8H6CNW5_9LECA|nr:uncharacterized protein HO133_008281 [Letharia lupina]KAF6226840.1 hypothetical protein HO133_008281 [Letharia lupina]
MTWAPVLMVPSRDWASQPPGPPKAFQTIFSRTFRRAAPQKQLLAELYQELWDKPKAGSAYEAAAQWCKDDNASALDNKLNLKAGDLAALDNGYLGAFRQAVTNNLMQSSIND